MTLQDALTALNPALTIGTQIVEVIAAHDDDLRCRGRARAPRRRAAEMLRAGRHSRSAAPRCATIRTSSPAACGSA